MDTGLHQGPPRLRQNSRQCYPKPPPTPIPQRARSHTIHVTESGSPVLTTAQRSPTDVHTVPGTPRCFSSPSKSMPNIHLPAKAANRCYTPSSQHRGTSTPNSGNSSPRSRFPVRAGSPPSYSRPLPHYRAHRRRNRLPSASSVPFPPRTTSRQIGLALTSDERVEIPELRNYRLRNLSRHSLIPGVGPQLKVADDADEIIYGESKGARVVRGTDRGVENVSFDDYKEKDTEIMDAPRLSYGSDPTHGEVRKETLSLGTMVRRAFGIFKKPISKKSRSRR